MSEKKNSSVGLQIEAPSPTPDRINFDIDMGHLPQWVSRIFPFFVHRKFNNYLPNLLTRPLTIEEKKFLLAVERGDIANVRRFEIYCY